MDSINEGRYFYLVIFSGSETGCWWGQKLMHQNETVVDPNKWTNEIPSRRPSLMEITKRDPELRKYFVRLRLGHRIGTSYWDMVFGHGIIGSG